MENAPSRATLETKARELGIDLVGVCDWNGLEESAPGYDSPSSISSYLTSLIVLGRRYSGGVACSPDDDLRQFALGRTARHLEESAAELAYWIEEHDGMAALLSAMIPDLRRQPLGYATPAGQGSLLLRQAAVAAGLGTLGLNQMLLTSQFGPRLFLAGVLTDLPLQADEPLPAELCPGLEDCGRCAAVCPTAAIPLEARSGAPLAAVRGLDHEACARASQPYGPARMVEHLERLFTAGSDEEAVAVVREPATQRLFYNLTVLRQGAFTGCARCELVCPVGEDYAAIEASAVRKRDLPQGVSFERRGDLVGITGVGSSSDPGSAAG